MTVTVICLNCNDNEPHMVVWPEDCSAVCPRCGNANVMPVVPCTCCNTPTVVSELTQGMCFDCCDDMCNMFNEPAIDTSEIERMKNDPSRREEPDDEDTNYCDISEDELSIPEMPMQQELEQDARERYEEYEPRRFGIVNGQTVDLNESEGYFGKSDADET